MLAGPLMWLVALSVLGAVVAGSDAVGYGLLIAAASFALAIPVLLLARHRRVREETGVEPGRGR